uniref:BZIP domain-containing protein n=1 Tax=Bionectria ochroleuca TaxID=29856 RepID=A0A8H7N5W8_BIOOC
MPRKHKTAESVIQDRENQRRSRARRRDYVQYLEARVREYEKTGAQATIEMQQAARAVQAENKSLRAILASYGLSPAAIQMKIDEDLKRAEPPPSTSDLQVHPEPTTPLEKPCEEAAAILAQLGNGSDSSSLRSLLGCVGEGRCFVRNTELMQIMEEETQR